MTMAVGLDSKLTGTAWSTYLPPIFVLRQRGQGLVPDTGKFGALSRPVSKVWHVISSASSGHEGRPPGEVQEVLWDLYFAQPTQWWDSRRSKPTPGNPGFKHKESEVALWLSNRHKPAWVDSQLATLDAGVKKKTPYSVSTPVQGQAAFAAPEGHLEVEICRKLCEDGLISEALDALNILVQRGCHVPNNLFYRVLKRCIMQKDLVSGRCIHALTVKSGYEGDSFLATHLIGLYASHGRLEEAMRVFTKVSTPDAYNWATIIFAYARQGEAPEAAQAIRLYRQMRDSTAVKPDDRIYSAVLKACATARDLVMGKQVHVHILAKRGKPDRFVQAGLVDMYAKCGSLEDARRVFDRLPDRNVVTWTTMIAGYAQQGLGQEALSLYSSMQQEDLSPPSSVTYICLLQACASVGVGALHDGKQLHAEIQEQGWQEDVVLGGSLVHMYAKCGSLEDARQVFNRLPERNVVTWTTMIAGYAKQGMGQEALSLYRSMQQEDLSPPSPVTYVCLLQACASVGVGALLQGKQLHAEIERKGLQDDMVLCGSLINMYAKCGSLEDACQVFNKLPSRTVVAWNALLAGYAQQGRGQEALNLYKNMQQEVSRPDSITYVCLLQACASVGVEALHEGKQLHAQIKVRGLPMDVVLGSSLVNMYAKCGSLDDARCLFDKLPVRDVVTWTTMFAGYAQQGMGEKALSLYMTMQQEELSPPSSITYLCLLQACASVGEGAVLQGKQIHADIQKRGLQDDVVLGSSLVNMYAKCGNLDYARQLFDGLPERTISAWNAMISGYAKQEMGQEALNLYRHMQLEGLSPPDAVTYVCLLQACASVGVGALHEGTQLHAQIQEQGLLKDVVLGGSLVHMYAQCGGLEDAQQLFDRLPEKNVITWTTMLTAYVQHGMGQEAIRLYSCMQQEGLSPPNSVTYVCLLQACAGVGVGALHEGKQLHARIKELGLEADVVLGGSLVNMYAKCGCLEDAREVFDKLPVWNLVAWTALLAGYAQQGMAHEALSLYSSMQQEGLTSATYVYLLQACASVGVEALHQGKQLHAEMKERGLLQDVVIGGSLVSMYAKCSCLEDARSVFDRLPEKDVVAWTAMIASYAQHGMGEEALGLYSSMQQDGLTRPDSVTYVCLLQSCASVGRDAHHEGKQLHAQIKDQGLEEDVVLGSSLVNMYVKCGSLEDARRLFDRLPDRTVVAWTAMLAGYAQGGMYQEAISLYSSMQQEGLTPDSVTYVCLLQACAVAAALPLGKKLHAEIVERGLQADVVVGAALLHMYAKCGSMFDSQLVFDSLPGKNAEAWGALISGYARQGNSEAVFDLLERMISEGSYPNEITCVSVLTVCSHVGLVDKGQKYFETMQTEYGIRPTIEHYTCMMDLLGRAGHLEEALQMANTMPFPPTDIVCHTLLGACLKWKNVEIGLQAFKCAMRVDEKDAASYVLMSNIYASAQMWGAAKEMQTRRKKLGAWKKPGQSWWTDMGGVVHTFVVGDKNHPESEGIYAQNEDGKIYAAPALSTV